MALTFEFCDARARDAASAAERATLQNVRERELRSEAVWREMAERLQTVKDGRREAEQERAART